MKNLADKKLAFLFQGVGADYKSFLDMLDKKQAELLKEYCSIVNKEIGMDLSNYLFSSQDTIYDRMFNGWIAIYTCDYIVYRTYVDLGVKPYMMLGYSMGLITALTCSRSISFETGLHMLLTIYEYPKGFEIKDEGMGVIIGKTCDEVYKIITDNSMQNEVFITSINNDTCIVISGKDQKINKVLEVAGAEGAIKASAVNSPYAFHCSYAARGIEKLADFVEYSPVGVSETPVISALNQRIIQNAADVKEELVKNMVTPMNWRDSILKLCDLADCFVEVSLDDSLTKMSRLINLDYEFITYKKLMRSVNG